MSLEVDSPTCGIPTRVSTPRQTGELRVACYGHFGAGNLGNESTLQAVLYNLYRFQPSARVTCVCTNPKAVARTHHVDAVPIGPTLYRTRRPESQPARMAVKLCRIAVFVVCEPYRWMRAFLLLRRQDVLIVPGTGLLTDAYGLFGWGPYNVFKWSLLARISHCKLLYVSVGVGPLRTRLGSWLVKTALSLAERRSYRDDASKQCLESIGFSFDEDRVRPDLVFSLPEVMIPRPVTRNGGRAVVGLGLMGSPGRYSPSNSAETHAAYLSSLVSFTTWLFARGYDVRLLVGDETDLRTKQDFKALLQERPMRPGEGRLVDEPVSSVAELMVQIATTSLVVATRFHNLLMAMLCGKPVMSISFHPKCESLMRQMGLSAYGLDMARLNAPGLIETFSDLEAHSEDVRISIEQKVVRFRQELDDEYRALFPEAHVRSEAVERLVGRPA